MRHLKIYYILLGVFLGCSSEPKKPFIEPAYPAYIGLERIGANVGFEGKFCTTGSKKNFGGIATMSDASQYAIGKCRHKLLDRRNLIIAYFGDRQISYEDYVKAEQDAVLPPIDYKEAPEVAAESSVPEVPVADCAAGSDCAKARELLNHSVLVYFDVDSDLPLSVQELKRVAEAARQNQSRLTVVGHADSTFTEEHNLSLSARRAKKVRDILVAFGVADNLISISGLSSRVPIDTNETAEGRAKNRRAEIKGVGNEH